MEGADLTQFEVLDTRDAIEYPAFEVICDVHGDVAVHEELHRLHKRERLRVHEDRLVADGHKELCIRCFGSREIADVTDDIEVSECR